MPSSDPVSRYQLAEIGSVLSDPARAAIVLALMDGSARPASELGRIAGVAPATASVHLRKLRDGGLLGVLAQGRHRYYRIAGEDVAHLVETLSLLRAPDRAVVKNRIADDAMIRARTCYRHLAGRLGVALFERLSANGGLRVASDAIHVTARGRALLVEHRLIAGDDDIESLLGRACVDWTERRFHLAGPLGTYLSQRLIDLGWLRRRRQSRALTISVEGAAGFCALGIDPEKPNADVG